MSTGLTSGVTADVMRSSATTETSDIKPGLVVQRQDPLPAGKEGPPASPGIPLPEKEFAQMVRALKDYVQNIRRELEFTVDEETDRVIVKVYDAETQEVIRQIPAEEVLNMARHLARGDGLLLKAKA